MEYYAYAPHFVFFVNLRFVLGFCIGGGSLTTYVIISENILPHQRALAGTFGNIAFALGNVVRKCFCLQYH